jgi:hypothetical protein
VNDKLESGVDDVEKLGVVSGSVVVKQPMQRRQHTADGDAAHGVELVLEITHEIDEEVRDDEAHLLASVVMLHRHHIEKVNLWWHSKRGEKWG